jgi:carbonic anhydrase
MAVPDPPSTAKAKPSTQDFTFYTATPCPSDLIPRTSPPRQQVLWIGCSDSGFEETTVLDLAPDETIVLRNIGNMVLEDDLSCASMLEYAVRVLRVRHIVVCGHYGCGIVSGRTAEAHLPLGPHFRYVQEQLLDMGVRVSGLMMSVEQPA